MRVPPNARFPRIAAFVVPTAIAMTFAACGTPTGPGDEQPRARVDPRTAGLRAIPLTDSTKYLADDSTGRGPVQPWY